MRVRRKWISHLLPFTTRFKRYVWIVIKLYGILLALYGVYRMYHATSYLTQTPSLKSRNNYSTSQDVPLILIWTFLQYEYKSWLYWTPLDPTTWDSFIAAKDSISKPMCDSSCAITFNRDLLYSSDAVLISLYDSKMCLYLNAVTSKILDFLTFGTLTDDLCWFPSSSFGEDKDVFLFFHEPPNILSSTINMETALNYFDSRADFTMSYRRDSTIFLPYINPSLEVKYNNISTNPSIRNLSSSSSKVPIKIAWIVSNCHSASQREDYVAILRQTLKVTIIGKCGVDLCSKSIPDCMELLVKEGYSYYLAFENEICDNYVTEKFDKTLKHDIVPIVMSGSLDSLEDVLPYRSSYIHIKDFKDPLDLVRHLQSMTKEGWMSHLEWKRAKKNIPSFGDYANLTISGKDQHFICQLCHLVTRNKDFKKGLSIRNSLISWWNQQVCLPSWRNFFD